MMDFMVHGLILVAIGALALTLVALSIGVTVLVWRDVRRGS